MAHHIVLSLDPIPKGLRYIREVLANMTPASESSLCRIFLPTEQDNQVALNSFILHDKQPWDQRRSFIFFQHVRGCQLIPHDVDIIKCPASPNAEILSDCTHGEDFYVGGTSCSVYMMLIFICAHLSYQYEGG